MDFWQILYVIDWVLFGMMALTTLYMLVFTITSLFFHQHEIPKARHQNRFIILIHSYKNPGVIQTVKSILAQASYHIYPKCYPVKFHAQILYAFLICNNSSTFLT